MICCCRPVFYTVHSAKRCEYPALDLCSTVRWKVALFDVQAQLRVDEYVCCVSWVFLTSRKCSCELWASTSHIDYVLITLRRTRLWSEDVHDNNCERATCRKQLWLFFKLLFQLVLCACTTATDCCVDTIFHAWPVKFSLHVVIFFPLTRVTCYYRVM